MTGPAFPDVVDMLQTLHGHSDIDVDRLLAEHPVTRDLPADTVDAALAGIGGFLLANSEGSHVEPLQCCEHTNGPPACVH